MAATGVGCMHTARQDHDPYGLLDQPEAIAREEEPLDLEQLRQEMDSNWARLMQIKLTYARAVAALRNADGMGDPGPTEQMRRDMEAAEDRYIDSLNAFNRARDRQQQTIHTQLATRVGHTASQNRFIVSMDGQDSSTNTSSTRPDHANATAHKLAYASYRLQTLLLNIDERQKFIAKLQTEIDRIAQGGGCGIFDVHPVEDPDRPGCWTIKKEELPWDDSGRFSRESVLVRYQRKLDKKKLELKEFQEEYEDLVVQVAIRGVERHDQHGIDNIHANIDLSSLSCGATHDDNHAIIQRCLTQLEDHRARLIELQNDPNASPQQIEYERNWVAWYEKALARRRTT